MRVNMI